MRIFFFVVIIGLAAFLGQSCSHRYPVRDVGFTAGKSVSATEGKRMTMLMCGSCHYNTNTKAFTGNKLDDSPAAFGKVYARNITQDSVHGIGGYTDAQLAYLIRTGVSKDGRMMPYMQRPNIADEDLRAIITFLKSDDPSVAPSDRTAGKTSYTILGKLAINTVKPFEYKTTPVNRPQEKGVVLGRYLVDNLACFHCHSKSFVKLNISEPEKSKGFMGGGNKLKAGGGETVRSPNLTPHPTGLKNWTLSDFRKAITEGISKDGSVIAYPMPMFDELKDYEIESMYAYIQTLKPLNNAINND